MQFRMKVAASLIALLGSAHAFTITSPTAGSTIDPTQSITLTWTSTSSDPSVFNLVLDNTNTDSLTNDQTIESGISTARGSYTIAPNTLLNYGTGFVLKATDQTGSDLATSDTFTLGAGSSQVSTNSDGQISFVSVATATATAGAGSTAAVDGTVTATVTPSADATATGAASTPATSEGSSRTESSEEASSSSTGARSTGSSFVTSTASRTSSETSSRASAAATTTNSANSQARLSSEAVLSAAGVLAGVVALLA